MLQYLHCIIQFRMLFVVKAEEKYYCAFSSVQREKLLGFFNINLQKERGEEKMSKEREDEKKVKAITNVVQFIY